MPDATIGWGGPSVSGTLGNPNAAAALAPSVAAPMGYSGISSAVANAIAAALGSNQAAANLGLTAASPSPEGMVSAHGWGAPVSSLSNLGPEESAALSQALGVVSTMNTNQAAINDAIANNQAPVGIPNQTAEDAYGHTSLAPDQTAPSIAVMGYNDAVNAPMGYDQGLNLGQTSQAEQAAALADAMGYADSQASPTGYGYGLNLGMDSMNLGNPDDAAPAAAAAANEADSMGYGYGLSLGAPDSAAPAGFGSEGFGSEGATGAEGATGQGGNEGGGIGSPGGIGASGGEGGGTGGEGW